MRFAFVNGCGSKGKSWLQARHFFVQYLSTGVHCNNYYYWLKFFCTLFLLCRYCSPAGLSMDGDILPLLDFCLDTFQLQHRGGKLEEARSFLNVDKMSVHSAHDIRDSDKYFAVVQNHCKQVLKQLNDTELDFVLLSCEV